MATQKGSWPQGTGGSTPPSAKHLNKGNIIEKKQYKIRNFAYNGFFGKNLPGYMPCTAQFVEWTSDPGITRCMCSDSKERLIPTYALEGFDYEDYPEQEKTGVYFGLPSSSSGKVGFMQTGL